MLEKYATIKAMKTVLCNPTKRFSVRELERTSKLSIYSCKYSLDYMYERELVKLEKIGRTYQYQANLDNYLTRQWKIIFSLEELDASGVVKNILKTNVSALSIILYGSVAIGRDDKNSDIDMLIIADTDKKGKKRIAECAHGTKQEINISVYTPHEWKEKAKKDKIFYESVIIDSIALYGEKPVVF